MGTWYSLIWPCFTTKQRFTVIKSFNKTVVPFQGVYIMQVKVLIGECICSKTLARYEIIGKFQTFTKDYNAVFPWSLASLLKYLSTLLYWRLHEQYGGFVTTNIV